MPLVDDSIVQENTGTTSTTSVVVTLPTGTQAGSTILVGITSATIVGTFTLPTGFVVDVGVSTTQSTTTGTTWIARKSGTAAGETSWTFTSGGATSLAWYVAEVAGLDLADPLDTSAASTSSSVLASATVGKTSGTTGANPGADTFLLACFAADSSSLGSWSAFTNGFAAAGSAQVGTRLIQAARKLSGGAVTGPFETTGTYTAGAGSTSNVFGTIAVYRAADSPIVNPLTTMVGFEHGTSNGLASSLLGITSIVLVTGTAGTDVVVQSGSARGSGYGCRITASASVRYVQPQPWPATAKAAVLGFDVRVVSGSGTVVVAELVPGAGSALQVVYDVSGTRFGVRWGAAGTVSWQAGTTALNTWAWVDLRFAGVATATWAASWRLETGAGVYTDQTPPANLTGQTASSVGTVVVGGTSAGPTQTAVFDFDNIVLSAFAATYPFGPHTLQVVKVDPAGTPTVSGTVGNFALVTSNATGAALTSGTLTSARDAIDELPPTISASSDGVVQTTAAASDYLQFPLDTFTVGTSRVIAGARVLAALISTTGAGAGNLGIRGWDGAAEAAVITATGVTPGSASTPSATVPPWAAGMWAPPGGWTQAKLDAAALRLGFSSDATPDMGVHAVYLEVATRAATTARQVDVEDGTFTVDVNLDPSTSASVSYTVTSSDPIRGATFDYSVAGVAQTPVVVAASTSAVVDVEAGAFGDITDVTLTPDP